MTKAAQAQKIDPIQSTRTGKAGVDIDIGFQVQLNVEITSQVMDFP